MGYDPDKDKGRTNNGPLGGPVEDEAKKRQAGWDALAAQQEASGNGQWKDGVNVKATADFNKGVGDVAGWASKTFFGSQDAPGLFGGKRTVNSDAYWDISGDPYRQGASGFAGRGPGFERGAQDQGRMQQQQLIQMLQGQAMGQGPSLAAGQMRQATDRNIAQQQAMSASGRGPGAAGAAYQSQNMAAAANQQAAADTSQLRLQEQLQAQGLLGSILGQTRGQDQSFGSLQLQDQKQRDDLVSQFMKMGYDADQANRQAAMKMEELKNTAYNGANGGGGFLGGLFSSLSDETAKTEIQDADGEISAFLDALEPHSYKYKDEKNGKGRRISVMAQELEKSKLGEEFIFEKDGLKNVDYGKGLGTMLAAQAALHKRLKKLEGK
jgi:hypothetical protein